MNLDDITPDVLLARGKYSTVNGELKTLMSTAQGWTQKACDALRHGLQADDHEKMREQFELASKAILALLLIPDDVAELKRQKEELWNQAWGKK